MSEQISKDRTLELFDSKTCFQPGLRVQREPSDFTASLYGSGQGCPQLRASDEHYLSK